MENVKFKYFYRDGSNFKRWSEIIFSNPNGFSLEAAAKAFGDAFTKDGLFTAHQIRVPEVFIYDDGDANADDHCYHEFYEVIETSENPNDRHARSIDRFVAEVQRIPSRAWFAFDPFERWLGRSSSV
jgi:hypothetical protein